MSIISDLVKYSRLALSLRTFLNNTISLEQSKQVISERLRNREQNFLTVIQRGVYQNPKSPYLKLLRSAGCEFGDIESLVSRDGVEGTLQNLYDNGVYLSTEEYKGRRDIVRGGIRFPLRQSDLDNPFIPHWYQGQSSGTRSVGTRTTFDLRHKLEQSYYWLPILEASNALEVPLAIWKPVLPSMSGISHVLYFWIAGKPVARWFSPVDESGVQASVTHRLALRYLLYGSRLWGARLVKPEFVGLLHADRVAGWMADTKNEYGGCSLSCSVSSGVKVCQAALSNNLDIQGTHFFVSGEPLTEAKRQLIESTGATVTPRYTTSELGRIGCGCTSNTATDDVHLVSDSIAVIQHRRKVEHTPVDVNAFLFTTILPTAPKVLLNFESDDYGVMETRSCDCIFGQLGFDRHLHSIRSFDKLTGSGMTVVGSDFVRILEEVLPRRYGGAPTDYQLLEEEDSRGQTRLSLIISPAVGEVDERDVINTILVEMGRNDRIGALSASLWSQAEALCVKRMNPIPRSGKVVTLELMKKR